MPEIIAHERHFGAQLTAGQKCAPGDLMYVTSAGTVNVADHTDNDWAHGVALTSGSGTKVVGVSQYVRLDRIARVVHSAWSWTIGASIYLGESGAYSSGGTQKVGFALDDDEVFVDLDMQLGE